MENPIITNLKSSLSKKDLERFENANFQEWYLVDLYKNSPIPQDINFKRKVLAALDALEGI